MQYTDHRGNKYVFRIGTELIYANGMVPQPSQKYPGFGDTGVVIAMPKERHAMTPNMPNVTVKFARCGIHTQAIHCFWPPGSKAAEIGQLLVNLLS